MRETVALVLTNPGHENKTDAITADTAYLFDDIVGLLSSIIGKKVTYLKPDPYTYINGLISTGVPKEAASFLGGFGAAIGNGEFDTDGSDLEKLFGKKQWN